MSQRFDKTKMRTDGSRRRKELVSLDAGDLWVFEMTVAESAGLADRASRPAIDPRGGMDPAATIVYQIMLCCYESDEPGANRVFNDADIPLIHSLRMEEMTRIVQAIQRVNGLNPEEVDVTRDFFGANGEASSSPALSSVSSS